jgi:uncharacterized protein (TIGR02266 family)
MTDEFSGSGGQTSDNDDLIEIDLNFESMRRFQAEFSPNLSKDGLFIDTGEPLSPGSVVRFRVILPESFVFLEGTAVVEWRRGAEAIADGSPGMALRFVTLSTQNEELVEQLVQDYVDAGGTPFNLNVKPVLSDFPTDALEGAPAEPDETEDEGYRLTVRGAGLSVEAEALQALADAAPDGGPQPDEAVENGDLEEMASAADDSEDATTTEETTVEPTGFEISSPPVGSGPRSDEAETAEDPEVHQGIGEPPEIDWSADSEEDAPAPADEPATTTDVIDTAVTEALPVPDDVAAEPGPEPEPEPEPETEEVESEATRMISMPDRLEAPPAETDETFGKDVESGVTDVLDIPEEFAAGPEVIEADEVDDAGEVDQDLGSPAFDVSLPEPDDEPDTTPVLPDEGIDDVTVPSDDEVVAPPRRRLWPFGLAAVLILAVAAGFLSPQVKTWLESRGGGEPVVAEAGPSGTETAQSETESPPESSTDPEATDEPAAGDPESGSAEAPPIDEGPGPDETVDQTPPDPVVAQPEPEPEPEPVPARAVAPAAAADTVLSIGVEPGPDGTRVSIVGNGSLEDGAVSMENLSSPPRVLVRLRGIASSYRPYTIESATPEVTRARIGQHQERRPPELWIVLDLAAPDLEVAGIEIAGDRVGFAVVSR